MITMTILPPISFIAFWKGLRASRSSASLTTALQPILFCQGLIWHITSYVSDDPFIYQGTAWTT